MAIDLEERPDSPRRGGDGTSSTIQRLYNLDKATDHTPYIPQPMAPSEDGYFLSWQRMTANPAYDILVLEYTDNDQIKGGGSGQTHKDGDEEWLIAQAGTTDKPLEEHPDYRMKWNHELYEWLADSDDVLSPTPAWWDTAVTAEDASGIENVSEYLWSKDVPSAPKDGYWTKVKDRTMTSDGYLYRPMTIDHVMYYKKQAKAESAYQNTPVRKLPSDVKGITGSTADNWLCTGVQAPTFDGSLWVVINEYVYNPTGWNTTLYGT